MHSHTVVRSSLPLVYQAQLAFILSPPIRIFCCKSRLTWSGYTHISHQLPSPTQPAGVAELMLGCLVWMRLASRPHGGHPLPSVLFATVALHLCPQTPHLQVAVKWLYAVTVSGVRSPLAPQSHSAATSGWLWAKSLQGHTALPVLLGQPVPAVRWPIRACHLCGCPVLHMPLLHQAFLWL